MTREFSEPFFEVRGDGFGETAGRTAEQVAAFLDDGGADVGDRPHVGEGQLSAGPLDEVSRGPQRSARLRREVDSHEDP